jgi:hypothetical protein
MGGLLLHMTRATAGYRGPGHRSRDKSAGQGASALRRTGHTTLSHTCHTPYTQPAQHHASHTRMHMYSRYICIHKQILVIADMQAHVRTCAHSQLNATQLAVAQHAMHTHSHADTPRTRTVPAGSPRHRCRANPSLPFAPKPLPNAEKILSVPLELLQFAPKLS